MRSQEQVKELIYLMGPKERGHTVPGSNNAEGGLTATVGEGESCQRQGKRCEPGPVQLLK